MKKSVWGRIVLLVIIVLGVVYQEIKPEAPDADKIATVTDTTDSEVADEVEEMEVEEEEEEVELTAFALDAADGEYAVAEGSTIHWVGRKPGGEHDGTVAIQEATLTVQWGTITDGYVVVDMNNMTSIDIEDEDGKAKILGHLQEGFFNVATFPVATFNFTNAQSATDGTDRVSGVLEMVGVENELTFPAEIMTDGTDVMVKAEFAFDRLLWGIEENKAVVDKFIEVDFDLVFEGSEVVEATDDVATTGDVLTGEVLTGDVLTGDNAGAEGTTADTDEVGGAADDEGDSASAQAEGFDATE